MIMPFGLTNALTTFQSLMTEVFVDHLRDIVLVFYDDILIYNPNIETHMVYLRKVYELLRKNRLFVKKIV